MMKTGLTVKVDAQYGASVTVSNSTYFPQDEASPNGPVERFQISFDAPIPVLVFSREDATALRNALTAALEEGEPEIRRPLTMVEKRALVEVAVVERRDGPTQEAVFEYLAELRDSGETNMFGATPYIEREFGLDRDEAKTFLMAWMKSFKKEGIA